MVHFQQITFTFVVLSAREGQRERERRGIRTRNYLIATAESNVSLHYQECIPVCTKAVSVTYIILLSIEPPSHRSANASVVRVAWSTQAQRVRWQFGRCYE